MPERDTRPRLDLDEHEFGAVPGDEVDLALRAPPVAVNDGEAPGDEKARRNRFTPPPEGVFRCHDSSVAASAP